VENELEPSFGHSGPIPPLFPSMHHIHTHRHACVHRHSHPALQKPTAQVCSQMVGLILSSHSRGHPDPGGAGRWTSPPGQASAVQDALTRKEGRQCSLPGELAAKCTCETEVRSAEQGTLTQLLACHPALAVCGPSHAHSPLPGLGPLGG
jgi:hypothetical protein